MKMRRLFALTLCLMMLLSFWAYAAPVSFSDVKSADWFYAYVSDLSKAGIVSGYPDGTFKPNNLVRWDEALKLILLAAGWPEQQATGANWASGYRDFAVGKGWVSTDENYDPSRTITRMEVAKLTARALGLKQYFMVSPFADCNDLEVLSLVDAGIIQGILKDDRMIFNGDGALHRSEISAIIWRMGKYREIHPELPVIEVSVIPPVEEEPQTPGIPPVEELPDVPDTEVPKPETPAPADVPEGYFLYNNQLFQAKENVRVFSYDPSTFYMEGGRMCCSDRKVKLTHGIDVSSHQGVIDWNAVKEDGIDFAFIRVGYRGYGTEGNLRLDDNYEMNLTHAAEAGIKVGVYFYSQAITEDEAKEEAELLLSAIEDYDLDLPVVYDWEINTASGSRTKNIPADTVNACTKAFCKRIKKAGYDTIVYFNTDWGYRIFDLSLFTGSQFWLAQYRAQPNFYYNIDYWQYSAKGKVDGISTDVDLDVRLQNKR